MEKSTTGELYVQPCSPKIPCPSKTLQELGVAVKKQNKTAYRTGRLDTVAGSGGKGELDSLILEQNLPTWLALCVLCARVSRPSRT